MKEKTAKQILDEIDAEIVKAQGKTKSHHLTRITGSRKPSEHVVFTDGTEIAYSKAEEELLVSALYIEDRIRKGKAI